MGNGGVARMRKGGVGPDGGRGLRRGGGARGVRAGFWGEKRVFWGFFLGGGGVFEGDGGVV